MIEKMNFIKKKIGSSIGNELTVDDYKSMDELYGSGDFDQNQTLVDAEEHLASSIEGLARLFSREETLVTELRNEASKSQTNDEK